MRPIEDYLEETDALTREVVDTWGENVRLGNAHSLDDDFKALFDKAFAYRAARIIVESHRELHILTVTEVVNEHIAKYLFAEIYKTYWEKREAGVGK
jgi:hypothetical protein